MRTDVAAASLAVALVGGGCAMAGSVDGEGLPRDVRRFIQRRDLCGHFLGEEPYDAERARFLARQVRAHCTGTDRELAGLRERYRRSPAVLGRLASYEETLGY